MITLSQALDGYNLAAQARRLSSHTLADYRNTFRKLAAFLDGDPPFLEISKVQLQQFLASQTVGKKTLLNYHTGLSALWSWAYDEGLAVTNLLHQIERPRPEKRAIVPFSQNDVKLLIDAVRTSRPYLNHSVTVTNDLPNQERNRAIILLLLDTGIRAEELCSANIRDVDAKNTLIFVTGKGDKDRSIPFSARTGQAIWRSLAARPAARPDDPLFLATTGARLTRFRLREQLETLGERAGVRDVHPHRFRHTFSINYLRNGGDIYTLQAILGHTTLDMIKTYLAIAQADVQTAHRRASPVANWRL